MTDNVNGTIFISVRKIDMIGDAIAVERARWTYRRTVDANETWVALCREADESRYFPSEKEAGHFIRNRCIIAGLKAIGFECEMRGA